MKTIAEKAKISESQATTAVETLVSFLKDKMPGGIGGQVDTFIKGNTGALSGSVNEKIKEKVGGFFGK